MASKKTTTTGGARPRRKKPLNSVGKNASNLVYKYEKGTLASTYREFVKVKRSEGVSVRTLDDYESH
ncbi:hypothetical protein B4N84_12470, partial [Flavobacterium sp. IR1]